MDKIEIEIRAKHRMSHIDVLSSYFSKIKNESFKSKYKYVKVAYTIRQKSQSIYIICLLTIQPRDIY